MSNLEAIRDKAMIDSEAAAKKTRFGLFSQPISTAVGDNGAYKSKLRK